MPHRAIQFQKMQTHSQAVQTGNCHEQATSKLYNRHLHLRNPRAGDSVVRGAERTLWSPVCPKALEILMRSCSEHICIIMSFFFFFSFRRKLRHKKQKTWARQHLAKLGVDIYLWRSYCLPLILRSPFHDAGTVSSQIRGGWERNSAMLRFQLWLQPESATASHARGH